jgi:mitogen-activated protein kinase kinase
MATDAFKTKTMKRKNIRNLALNAPPRSVTPSAGDAQIPGALGNKDNSDTLEIGVEFRLDLRSEDLIVLKELGAGNGGTVSMVQHAATKVVMARKVRRRYNYGTSCMIRELIDWIRLYTLKRRRKCGNGS